MGRKSSMTAVQKLEAESRIYAGEEIRAVARDLNVAESTLRGMFGAARKDVKIVADQLVSAEQALRELPITAQIGALTLAAQLLSITNNLASAAHHGAMTASRLSAIAAKRSVKADHEDEMISMRAISDVGMLTKAANMAAEIPLNLIAKNKDAMDGLVREELKPKRTALKDLSDEQLKAEAAKYGIHI